MPNPRTKEFPLRHRFAISFTLQEFETSLVNNNTVLPMWVADQAKTEALAQAVQTNPANDAFEDVVTTPNCFMNSRINKIKITEYCMVPSAADVPDAMYYKAIITWGLGDHAIAAVDGTTLFSTIGFQKNADTIGANYSGNNLENAGFLHPDVDGLTTDGELEQAQIQPSGLETAKYGELGPKIRSMVVGPIRNRVHKDFPYFSSRWFNTPSAAKRMNAFTGCFLYVGMNDVKTAVATAVEHRFSPHFDSDLTIDENALNFHYLFEYNEYNDSFDQNA